MLEETPRPPSPFENPTLRYFSALSAYVLATAVIAVRLLVLYARRFPFLAGIPLCVMLLILAVAWVQVFQTYRRVLKARESSEEKAALLVRYKTRTRRLMVPTFALMGALIVFSFLRL
jgi:uncharacterized membrane protein